MRGRLITIAVLGVLAAAAAVSPALAGHQKVKHIATNVSIKTDAAAGTISGKVTSRKPACVTKRKVILNVDGDDVFNTKADQHGKYGIKTSDGSALNPGDYEVHAPKVRPNAKFVCDPGNSKISHVT